MVTLSKLNESKQFFNVNRVMFRITKTKTNANGTYTYTIKNTSMKYGFNRFKEIGSTTLDNIIKKHKKENKHLF